jgi:hypothetical protein
MERVDIYRDIIKCVIEEYASFLPGYEDVQAQIIFDDEHNHYLLYYSGWDKKKRVHGSTIHIDIRGDKVWVEHDGTKDGIVDELLKAGIPESQIVLGFHHPNARKYTEFAVA